MQDLAFVALTLCFFALAMGYVRFCDWLRWLCQLTQSSFLRSARVWLCICCMPCFARRNS